MENLNLKNVYHSETKNIIDIKCKTTVFILHSNSKTTSVFLENIDETSISIFPDQNHGLSLTSKNPWENTTTPINPEKESFIVIKTPNIKTLFVTDATILFSDFKGINKNSLTNISSLFLRGCATLQCRNIVNDSTNLMIELHNDSKLITDDIFLVDHKLTFTLSQNADISIKNNDSFIRNCTLVDKRKEKTLNFENVFCDELTLNAKESNDVRFRVNRYVFLKVNDEAKITGFFESKKILFKGHHIFVEYLQKHFKNTNRLEFHDCSNIVKRKPSPTIFQNKSTSLKKDKHSITEIRDVSVKGNVILNLHHSVKLDCILTANNAPIDTTIQYSVQVNNLIFENLSDDFVELDILFDTSKLQTLNIENNVSVYSDSAFGKLKTIDCTRSRISFNLLDTEETTINSKDGSDISINIAFIHSLYLNNEQGEFTIKEDGFIDKLKYNGTKDHVATLGNAYIKRASIQASGNGVIGLHSDAVSVNKNDDTHIVLFCLKANGLNLYNKNKNISIEEKNPPKSEYSSFSKEKAEVFKLLEYDYPTEYIHAGNREKIIKGLGFIKKQEIQRLTKQDAKKIKDLISIYTDFKDNIVSF